MSNKAIILSHSGKQHSYYVANALKELGYLKAFYTSSYVTSRALQNFVLKNGFDFWTKRFIPGLGSPEVKAHWQYEIKELLYRKVYSSGAKVNQMVYQRDQLFDAAIAKKITGEQFDIFWGFQGSCLKSLMSSQGINKKTVCEMTIAHLPFAKKILEEEARLLPEWADSIDFTSFPAEYEQRLIEEPHIADHVIAISSFLKKTLVEESVSEDKVSVIPLGFDINAVRYKPESPGISNRPLKLLYAGRVTQRKGMQYLLDAVSRFDKKDVELHVIGNVHGEGKAFFQQKDLFNYKPGVSQVEIYRRYSEYDVLVFPSVLEGFGLVAIEAMGAGLPVITTPNTNATEILREGENGFTVPIRDSDAIVSAISRIRSMQDEEFNALRANARQTALNYTWQQYQVKLSQFLKSIA